MKQYLDLCNRIVSEGKWVDNKRTNTKCLTVINADLTYNVDKREFPLITTRKCSWKSAIAELIGYIRGYTSAEQFRKLGTKTWDANANSNEAWLNNPHRKGFDDMGKVYGAVARNYPTHTGQTIDLLKKVVTNLTKGIDDRGEIVTFYDAGNIELGCLRPCMYSHHFSLLEGELYLNSTQRSCDVPLGLAFNMVQSYTFLALMAQITGRRAGKAHHKIVNAHIYEDQLDQMRDIQLKRIPFESPKLIINPNIRTLEDLETWVTLEDFQLEGYRHHEPISFPFSV